jgi:molecular chaperone HtpG
MCTYFLEIFPTFSSLRDKSSLRLILLFNAL